MPSVSEGKIVIDVEAPKIVSKEMTVFYNPEMKLNRDISIAVISSMEGPLLIADPLAGTGIRTLRILAEVPSKKIAEVHANDMYHGFANTLNAQLKKNKISQKKLHLACTEANIFLLKSRHFDYIDVDPFGSPNPFLESAIKRLRSGSILAVTATDTAALCGTSVKACRRKYWAEPLHSPIMKEIAIRILIRKVQLVASGLEFAVEPIMSYSHKHYFRIYFRRVAAGSERVDNILSQHKFAHWCKECQKAYIAERCRHKNVLEFGPIWTGRINDREFIGKVKSNTKELDAVLLLDTLYSESAFTEIGFFDVHSLCKAHHMQPPSFDKIERELKGQKHSFCRTVFSPTGMRTDAAPATVLGIIKRLNAV